jgi:hypothetical protein
MSFTPSTIAKSFIDILQVQCTGHNIPEILATHTCMSFEYLLVYEQKIPSFITITYLPLVLPYANMKWWMNNLKYGMFMMVNQLTSDTEFCWQCNKMDCFVHSLFHRTLGWSQICLFVCLVGFFFFLVIDGILEHTKSGLDKYTCFYNNKKKSKVINLRYAEWRGKQCVNRVHNPKTHTNHSTYGPVIVWLFMALRPAQQFFIYHCRWRAAKLWVGRDLYRATPAVTRDLDF